MVIDGLRKIFSKGDQINYPPIVISGPHRVAKSSTLDRLEEAYPGLFERGTKSKYRVDGPWPTDGQKKDSLVLRTIEEGEKLIREGKSALDYHGPDTWHVVHSKDAMRTDKSMVYIADVFEGSMKFKQFFTVINSKEPITYLFYTHPKLIETRLKHADFKEEQISKRLREFKNEFAIFRENAAEYLFLMEIKWPPINSNIVLDYAAKEKERTEIRGYTDRLVKLVKAYADYSPCSRDGDYLGIHHAYINDLSSKLVNSDLEALKVNLQNQEPVFIDLEEELNQYLNSKPLPNKIKDMVKKVEIVRYQKANGRYSLWLDALVKPFDRKDPDIGDYDLDPEDVVLDLLKIKLGEPTKRKIMKDQNFSKKSHFGLVNVEGTVLRDGTLYSLGDPLITDHTHPPLVIGFLSKNGKQPHYMNGFTGEQINIMQQYLNGDI